MDGPKTRMHLGCACKCSIPSAQARRTERPEQDRVEQDRAGQGRALPLPNAGDQETGTFLRVGDNEAAICAACGAGLTSAIDHGHPGSRGDNLEDVLRVTLSGAYGEFLDTFTGDLTALLCRACAKELLGAHPWLAQLAAQALDINVGHTCNNGDILWIPLSECPHDPDRHGWASVYGP